MNIFGLAPILERRFDINKEDNAQGKTILLVEQYAFAALNLTHYAYVLEVGRNLLVGSGEELNKKSAGEGGLFSVVMTLFATRKSSRRAQSKRVA